MPQKYLRELLIVAAAAGVLSASSWVAIPVGPVPITLQTAVLLVGGALLGAPRSCLVVLLWLVVALLGAPLLAGGAGGVDGVFGPTAGYLLGFFPAAGLASLARGPFVRDLALFLIAHALILGLGASWLARLIGIAAAWEHGVFPFLAGAVVKSLAAALLVVWLRRRTQSWHVEQT